MFYAIRIPSAEPNFRSPSLDFIPLPDCSSEELDKVRQEIQGTMVTLVQFESEKEFQLSMDEIDEEYFRKNSYSTEE
jgi:hypothetical protein